MKILHAVHLFPPAMGGIEHHTYNLAKELVKNGEDVEVFTTRIPGTKNSELTDGIKVRRFSSIVFPLFSSVRFSPSMFLALLRSDADVFCSHGYGSLMPYFTSIAALIKRKPFIFTLHGYPRLRGLAGFFQVFYKFFIASVFLKVARKIIVVSKVSADEIKGEADASKIAYIANGIDAEKFECPPFSDEKVISYIGRLDRDKGIDVLVRAFAEIRQKFRDTRLSIVGRDEGMKADLVSLASAYGIGESISFSEVPYSEIGKEYCKSLAIVLPSRYEGFPLIWLETAASGRAMFSTRVGDYRNFFTSIYGKDADLFLFSDEKELESKLIYFLANKEKFAGIISKAKESLKREYSWQKIAKETLEAYRLAR